MEAFATLSFVGNVIQLVEVSTKLVKTTIKLANSASKVPNEINDAIVIRDSLVSLLQANKAPRPTRFEHDRQLLRLAEGCQKVCEELLNHVSRIKGKGDSSKTGVLGVSWRTLTSGGKLNSIEQRLDRYRSQILAHIIVMLDHKQSATYNLIESSIKQQNAHTQDLRQLIDKTKDNVVKAIKSELNIPQLKTSRDRVQFDHYDRLTVSNLEQITPEHSNEQRYYSYVAPKTQSDILVAVRTALATIAQASKDITVQDWLYFPELLSRERAIDDAHENTFTWLLHDGDPNENFEDHETHYYDYQRDPERSRNRGAMCKWLKSGSGIFYISGKAGSGKSTLMKHLAGAPQTREHLADWAHKDGKDLIFAEFFFWRSGTPLQRDIEGLYLGILWKILSAHPDFTKDISSALLGDKDGAFDGRIRPPKPTLLELEAAFDILIKSPKALSKHRVCLFIDGLDEFEGDYWKLSQRLVNWCASDDVKICVSSRPRNEFSKAFNAVPGATWFSLHDLTEPDMFYFVRDTFKKDLRYTEACAEDPDCSSLLYSIVNRADGVFLWVRLVVSELLIDMGNCWSLVQLRQKLNQIPGDLRSLFSQMLRRVNRLERVKLARTFVLMMNSELKTESQGFRSRLGDIRVSVYAQAVLDDIADNPDLEAQLLDGSLGPCLSEFDCISKCDQMCRRLVGRCQGLLDIVETNLPFPNCHTVSFFHRSVVDFLKEPKVESDVQEIVRGFNPRRALAHVILAAVKFLRLDDNPLHHLDHRLTQSDAGIASKNYESWYLGEFVLGIVSLSTDDVSLFDEIKSLRRMVRQIGHRGERLVLGRLEYKKELIMQTEMIDTEDLDSAVLCNVLSVCHADKLAREIIRREPAILDNPRWNPLLSTWLYAIPSMSESQVSLIRLLLDNGVSPNRELASKVCYYDETSLRFRSATMPLPMTPWMLALWNLSLNWSFCESQKLRFLSCIELLLANGANPFVCFVGYKVHRSENEDSSGPKSKGQKISGPYYADLMTMMKIWELQPTKKIQRLLSSHLSRIPAQLGKCFRPLGQRRKILLEHIHPIQLDLPINTKFQVLCVLPRQDLTRVSIRDLEEQYEIYSRVNARVTKVSLVKTGRLTRRLPGYC
ncbi:hypothetical protein F4679DRAFT_564968 [Xylaria curta]|nr:hypothetical protein F4679DRAFT_564968 [Xylaria curta]